MIIIILLLELCIVIQFIRTRDKRTIKDLIIFAIIGFCIFKINIIMYLFAKFTNFLAKASYNAGSVPIPAPVLAEARKGHTIIILIVLLLILIISRPIVLQGIRRLEKSKKHRDNKH